MAHIISGFAAIFTATTNHSAWSMLSECLYPVPL